jgi:hypothetical protein
MPMNGKTEAAYAVGSLVAFLLGWRRVSGAITLFRGVQNLSNKRNAIGGVDVAIGSSFLLFPTWPEAIGDALKSSTVTKQTTTTTDIKRVSYTQPRDVLIDGGYTILDVSETQSAALASRAQHLNPGDVVNLALQSHGGDPVAYAVTVISGQGKNETYVGKWTSRVPPGAPSFVEFSANHVYSAH